MKLTDTPIPERLRRRPQFKGFPIPYTTLVDLTTKEPDFKVTDIGAWQHCVRERLCALCAEPLDYWVWYIGSQQHIENELFFDFAMHRDCALYACQVCPYIALGKAYGHTMKPHPDAQIIELESRDELSNEGVPVYLARGRRDAVRPLECCQVKSGTLFDVELIERKKGSSWEGYEHAESQRVGGTF